MLASPADYQRRYGQVDDPESLRADLDAASSMVRREARLHISRVVDDVLVVNGTGTPALWLPVLPVIDVESVTVDGDVVDPDSYEVWPHGEIRLHSGRWLRRARLATVVVTHGWDPVEEWIVALVCSTVQRSRLDQVLERTQSETTGSQTVAYAVSAAGAALWLTRDECSKLRALRGPQAR